MLLAREKKIVTLLMEHEDKLTTTQIATSLKVSSRTIKTDIKKINEELEKHSCRINSQQGVGLWIEYDNHEAQKYLKEVARDTVDSYLSPEVRKYHLAVELLLKDDYTSMEALAKEYYISKATVLNDLNELDELWEHYGIRFIKKVKYGIKVEGNESQIRSALLEALKRAGGRQKVTISNIQNHFTAVELKDLREIINQMEGRFQFILTDISVGELTMDLAVMLERLSAGKTMDHEGSIPGRESRRMDFVLGHLKEYLTVIINISPRQMKAHGYGYIMAPLIENLAKRASVPVAFNLDHGANFEDITAAMQYGFSSVMIDSSSYEFEENVRRTQQIASLAHGMGLSCEAELGHVGQAAQADDSNVDLYTNVKQAKEFVERTNCDCLAVAIGTAHGAYPKGMIPKLDFERLKELKAELDMPLVLHGGSGAGEENIRKAVACGINKINVCTDLMRHATNASIATGSTSSSFGS